MPFAHIGFDVRPAKWGEVVAFYSKALAPLGYVEVMRIELGIMLGVKGAYELWIGKKEDAYERLNIHLALTAEDQSKVRAFHEAALAAGGKCNGPPGIRKQYAPTYYAAFVIDPVGNNLEVVCHCENAETTGAE